MLDASYQALCKILGKLAYEYDTAGGAITPNQQALSALLAQTAKPDAPSNNATVLIIAASAPQINANIANGDVALQASVLLAASNYLTGAQVASYFVHTIPATGASAAAVITALIAEMTTDNAYFSTVSTAGLVHFLEQISAGASALPQTGSGNQYTDATYCVVTVL